jgi:hypothetical protein
MLDTGSPRYSVRMAALEAEKRSRTSVTTATFSGLGSRTLSFTLAPFETADSRRHRQRA